jgi:hypothetical protein
METPPPITQQLPPHQASKEDARRAVAETLLALAEALAEASRVEADASSNSRTLNEAVGSLLPLEGLIEEAAALHAAVIALHRRSRE